MKYIESKQLSDGAYDHSEVQEAYEAGFEVNFFSPSWGQWFTIENPAFPKTYLYRVVVPDSYKPQFVKGEYKMKAVNELNLEELKESLKHVRTDVWFLPEELERLEFHPAVAEYVRQSKPAAILELINKYESLVDALELAKNGLEWYHGEFPHVVNQSDEEAMQEIHKALDNLKNL